MNIELYIANQLCDLEKSDLAIKLRRQFINPSELNIKDAQKSYSITLPSTPTNDKIFRYTNVEEAKGKFATYPHAMLYANGILIFEGKFRLTEITPNTYRGNLAMPTPLTAKDIFGDRKMNEGSPWMIPFEDATSMSLYNKQDSPVCVFPFALYGLLQKTSSGNRALIDTNTRFRLEDFPPSTNCIELVKKMFSQAKYNLSGTALSDERLKNLYVSYHNPNEYVMPFNYKKVVIEGKWSNSVNLKLEKQSRTNLHDYTTGYDLDSNEEKHSPHNFVACDLFQSDNLSILQTVDESHLLHISGGNKITYRVPVDGLYKINLHKVTLQLKGGSLSRAIYDTNNTKMFIVSTEQNGFKRNFSNTLCELKVVKSTEDQYDLSKATMDNTFYQKNQNQQFGASNAIFPQANDVNFVDIAQNESLLCGLAWGRPVNDNYSYLKLDNSPQEYFPIAEYVNPNQNASKMWCNPIAIKHGKSCQSSNTYLTALAATHSTGYTNGQYKVDLKNAPSKASIENNNTLAKGEITQVVWLNAGEVITLLSVTDKARHIDWIHQEIGFTLQIEPFSPNLNWLKMDAETGSATAQMDFNDAVEFSTTQIDLMRFQPKEIKIDDWLSNFCKAFNLQLTYAGTDCFELNLKNKDSNAQTSKIIDLDNKASVQHAVNESLSLPSTYELGFTIDTSEQGYVESLKDGKINEGNTGGGKFDTGSNEGNKITQNSTFSYCWYKELTDSMQGYKKIKVPVITDKEIWIESNGDKEMASKKYFNKAQRFWYKEKETHTLHLYRNTPVHLALVSNSYQGKKPLQLDYQDKPTSIMHNYFMLLTNQNNYTIVECYLTPQEYNDLPHSHIRFNGDLYSVAEADGYDPMGRSTTKLKLIKKM